ncbi:2981_t:CDS:2 [Diversispora eburnea]|uniref:2981_t:CDS:1 n=1 Tax=Diversispora eburnea TaxID=1213867 RepID=A0A9N9F5B3_9GLOM|nr:2981_t:CDS:2 [Diversispora eburnea]
METSGNKIDLEDMQTGFHDNDKTTNIREKNKENKVPDDGSIPMEYEYVRIIENYESENEKLKKEIASLEKARELSEKDNKEYRKECEQKIEEQKDQIIQYNSHINFLQSEKDNLQNRYNNLMASYEYKNKELDNIKKRNDFLQKEAAEYQSRLGDAKNFRLGDDDRNNSTHLTRDIEELQSEINIYARVKKGVSLNMEMVDNGLHEFDCSFESFKTSDEEEDNKKMLVKAFLQRVVLITIMDQMDKYLGQMDSIQKIQMDEKYEYLHELEVISRSKNLMTTVENFANNRDGKDEVSLVAPTKIRQQIYALLGDRGFSDITIKGEKISHPVIQNIASELSKVMNKYRSFSSEAKEKENDEMAPNIIREVIKIFYFRFKVQEPEAEYIWIKKGTKIDSTIMSGTWDDQVELWSVGLCFIPLIGINLNNEKHRKVLFPARVLAIKNKKGSKMGGIVKSIFSHNKRENSVDHKNSGQIQKEINRNKNRINNSEIIGSMFNNPPLSQIYSENPSKYTQASDQIKNSSQTRQTEKARNNNSSRNEKIVLNMDLSSLASYYDHSSPQNYSYTQDSQNNKHDLNNQTLRNDSFKDRNTSSHSSQDKNLASQDNSQNQNQNLNTPYQDHSEIDNSKKDNNTPPELPPKSPKSPK